jgi:hypothetical protein
MNRKFYGNQYIGKTWRTFKLVLSGTWIGIKEMFHNPGKVLLAVLMLGLALATFIETSTHHRLKISEAWADLTTDEEVRYVREVVEIEEEPAVILEKIARCESGGTQFKKDGTLIKRVNTDGSIDFGKYQINDKRHEHIAAKLGMNIYTEEGNEAYAKYLFNQQGSEPWFPSKPCWRPTK